MINKIFTILSAFLSTFLGIIINIYIFSLKIYKSNYLQCLIYNGNSYSNGIYDLKHNKWKKLNLYRTNIFQLKIISSLCQTRNFSLFIQGEYITQKRQLLSCNTIIKFPSTGYYSVSILSKKKELGNFSINITDQIPNSSDSFFECRTIKNTRRCWISNACLSHDGISIFGYDDFFFNYSLIVNPKERPANLEILNEGHISDDIFSENIGIFADFRSSSVFYHSLIESVYPVHELINTENILSKKKVIIIKKKTHTRLDLFDFINISTQYLSGKQCFKKLIIGFSNYYNFSTPDSSKFTFNPDLFNVNTRRLFRKMHQQYFSMNPELPQKDTKHLLFLNRPKSTHRSILNYYDVLYAISKKFPDWVITYTDFSGLLTSHEIKLLLQCDILLAIHGSALTNLLYLNDNSLIIEVFPYKFREFHHVYYDLAKKTDLELIEFQASKNSSIPISKKLRKKVLNDIKKDRDIFSTPKYKYYRSIIRDQNIILSSSEIDKLINILQKWK